MSARDIVQRWITEREAVMEADEKGAERPVAASVAFGSWNGSETAVDDLKREAAVLRFLARELDSDAEVEAARAKYEPPADTPAGPVHMVPKVGSSNTQCCDRLMFELPMSDRVTNDPELVTCPERWT